jgi:1-acyl-sn-glycerol-3-phosphate acyltransferase
MTDRTNPLGELTRDELMELAKAMEIRGRSRMKKAELLAALTTAFAETRGAGPEEDQSQGSVPLGLLAALYERGAERREATRRRLTAMVDHDRHCPWRSVEGHPCGLPVIVGAARCALHGGIDIEDLFVPIAGKLGFESWPPLLRQLWLASYDIDPIGLDPVIAELTWQVLNFFYFDYFRVEVEGIENVPMDGPGLLVSNHGGAAIPYDGLMLAVSVANEATKPRRVRVTATELFNILPWVSEWFRKSGGVYASREDVEYVLGRGHLVAVFPEGEKGFMKPVWNAYEVQRFGRGGFISIAEQAGAPIIPVAIIGSEEVHPAVTVSKRLARLVRLLMPEQRVEGVAVFLNPLPLPVRWKIRFLPPIPPSPPGAPPDPLEMLEKTEAVRNEIQRNLDEMLAERTSLF